MGGAFSSPLNAEVAGLDRCLYRLEHALPEYTWRPGRSCGGGYPIISRHEYSHTRRRWAIGISPAANGGGSILYEISQEAASSRPRRIWKTKTEAYMSSPW